MVPCPSYSRLMLLENIATNHIALSNFTRIELDWIKEKIVLNILNCWNIKRCIDSYWVLNLIDYLLSVTLLSIPNSHINLDIVAIPKENSKKQKTFAIYINKLPKRENTKLEKKLIKTYGFGLGIRVTRGYEDKYTVEPDPTFTT